MFTRHAPKFADTEMREEGFDGMKEAAAICFYFPEVEILRITAEPKLSVRQGVFGVARVVLG